MAIQGATTGQLENAQRIAIEETRYTAEHNAPMLQLIEQMKLGKGEKSITVPKVAQMTAVDLVDGIDIVSNADIGMTTTSLTTGEIGLKVVLTDKLVRQQNEDVFRIVGRQMGDAMARKKDIDILNLFSGFSTAIGATGVTMDISNLATNIVHAKANKFPAPISFVQHPWAYLDVVQSAGAGAAGSVAAAAFPAQFSQDLLNDFFNFTLNKVSFWEDGNLTVDSSSDANGAIFSKHAMVYVESVGFNTERQRNISLRGNELVVTADYGVFELDDAYGASLLYDASTTVAT